MGRVGGGCNFQWGGQCFNKVAFEPKIEGGTRYRYLGD